MSQYYWVGQIIRYRKGGSALMLITHTDELCGYKTYHGTHIFGEKISFPHSKECRLANKEEIRHWDRAHEFRSAA